MSAERTRGSRNSYTAHTTVTCDYRQPNGDGCQYTTPAKGDSAATVRRYLKEMGWVRVGGKDYCPAHAHPPRPGEAPDGYDWTRLAGRPVLLCHRCAGYVDNPAEHTRWHAEWHPLNEEADARAAELLATHVARDETQNAALDARAQPWLEPND